MNNPTDDFTKAVESALLAAREGELHKRYKTGRPEMSVAEALASIQASTVKLLEGLKAKGGRFLLDPKAQELNGEWENDELNAVPESEIDQLIKDLSNE